MDYVNHSQRYQSSQRGTEKTKEKTQNKQHTRPFVSFFDPEVDSKRHRDGFLCCCFPSSSQALIFGARLCYVMCRELRRIALYDVQI